MTEACNRNCSLNEVNLPIPTIAWFEDGRTYEWIAAEAKKAGYKLSVSSIGRHRQNHVAVVVADAPEGAAEKVDHLDVLQRIIAQGAKNVDKWRIGPADTLKAMDMYYKLTQGSAFEALLGALSAAASGNVDVDGPREEGLLSPAEQEAELSVAE